MTNSEILKAIEDLEDKTEELEGKRRKLLGKLGWKETCSTPGSRWLWKKKIVSGDIILTDTKTAIGIELDNVLE